jgi:hypothetical protein
MPGMGDRKQSENGVYRDGWLGPTWMTVNVLGFWWCIHSGSPALVNI